MSKLIQLEVCCGSYYDCVIAAKHQADRIELCSALELGGLTPSRSLFLKARQLGLPLAVMVRPRTAGFNYEDENYEVMLMDATWFVQNGASAVVFGFLHENGQIDAVRTKTLIDIAHAHGAQAVFHKAVDSTPDIYASFEQLIELGVDRVLTAGGIGKVSHHFDVLTQLQASYGHQIEVLPGGGVLLENIEALLETTKMSQIHMTAKEMAQDLSTIHADVKKQMTHEYVRVSDTYLRDVVALLKTISISKEQTDEY